MPQTSALPIELQSPCSGPEENRTLHSLLAREKRQPLEHASPLFLWERRDSNPLSFLCIGFTVRRPSAIWAALPIVHPKPLSMKRKRWLIASYAIVTISALSTNDFRFCIVGRTRTCDIHIPNVAFWPTELLLYIGYYFTIKLTTALPVVQGLNLYLFYN